jgi:polyphosphate glucokinase
MAAATATKTGSTAAAKRTAAKTTATKTPATKTAASKTAAATKTAATKTAATKRAAPKAAASTRGRTTRSRSSSTASRPASPTRRGRTRVNTLAIDIGGSGFKATVLDPDGQMLADRVRVDTPYPCSPDQFVETVTTLVEPLPESARVSVGFPGMVRKGVVLHVPSLSREVPGGPEVPKRAAAWSGYDLESRLRDAFGKPVLVMNDADVQACAAVDGKGFELVLTLGTGVGTAVFSDGTLLPHMELSHFPWGKKDSYDILLGNAERKKVGNAKWSKRVKKALADFDEVLFPDRVYLGGGNTKHLTIDLADLLERVSIVPNTAGLLGGVRVWEMGNV